MPRFDEEISGDEIEITSEMIAAGTDVVLSVLGDRDCLPGYFSAEALAERVFRAMDMMRK